MHFKRLEMTGFKSFVDYTVLDFEAGITAIVGPNGCGKSNVVDSLRWVMGEQNARALRGAKMEDVIFNGTDQRKALGMAEVALTIDNTDHQLPTDNPEVTITRRTYRSGESEYLLNKVPCRLRDIHDLISGTGLGTNAYSFLEQGKIDLIVSSKPSDRRFVFEEAAGISKYKSRKEESLRKLEATEQNFLRVSDIAAEVKRQIGTLERQAQKARRFQTLKQELTTLEVSRGRRELRDRRQALRKLEQNWQTQQTGLQELEARRNALELQHQTQAQEEQAVEQTLAAAQAELQRLLEALGKAEEFVANTAVRRQDLERALERGREELEALGAKGVQMDTQAAEAGNAQAALLAERQRSQASLAEEEKALLDLEDELKSQALRVQDGQQRLLQLVDQIANQRTELQNLESRSAEQSARVTRLTERKQVLEAQRQTLALQRTGLENENQGLQAGISGLETEKLALREELESLTRTLETLGAMVSNFQKTITQITSRVNWIQELKNSLDGYEAGAKALLREVHEHPEAIPGLLGPVANFIRTEAAYEFAFEAWLGVKLQYLLFETTAQAEAALKFLAAGDHGRATLLPLDRYAKNAAGPGADAGWLHLPGVLGRAIDLAKLDERFRTVFEMLFGSAVLVQDVDTARKVRAAGATCTLITLSGEVDAAEGWLAGGSTDLIERGWLGQERELAELNAELIVLQDNLHTAENEAAELKRRQEEIQGGLAAGENEWHELRIQAAKLDKSLEQVDAQIADAAAQVEAAEQERLQADAAGQQVIADLGATRQRLTHLDTLEQGTQADLVTRQAVIEARRRAYDQHADRAQELRVAAAGLDQRLETARAEADRVRAEQNELETRRQQLQQAREDDLARVAELDAQTQERRTQLQQWTAQKAAQAQEVERWSTRRRELLDRQHEADQAARKLQHSLDEAWQAVHAFEMDRRQQEYALKTLEDYLQAEYHLSLSVEDEAPIVEVPATPEEEGAPTASAAETPADLEARITDLKTKLAALGAVNLVAMEEYDELQTRFTFLSQQLGDLKEAKESLQRLITRINQESRARFQETFQQVRTHFHEVFRRLFNGGDAELVLVDENNLLETGIEIIARPPGKRLQNITLLSGGEKALTAIALLFAIYLIKPSPFCIFDEMDAPLDDQNTQRFGRILKEFALRSQFIVITHNKLTMEMANVLYGVTMQEAGVSRLISTRMTGEAQPRPAAPAPAVLAEKAAMN